MSNENRIRELLSNYYQNFYSSIHGSGVLEKFHLLVHRIIDWPMRNSKELRVLEVGAGNGIHRKLSILNWQIYDEVDIRNFQDINEESEFTKTRSHTRYCLDATYLDGIASQSYDVLIATCLLVHLENPITALENWRRVIVDGGMLVLYVPCEPGIFLRLTREFTSKKRIKKQGLPHGLIQWNDHINSWLRADTLVDFVFRDDKVVKNFFPFVFNSFDLNLFTIYRITKANLNEINLSER